MNAGQTPSHQSPANLKSATDSSSQMPSSWLDTISRKMGSLLDRQIPPEFFNDPERTRRARRITGFGLLGSMFGVVYAFAYLLIGHIWGAIIVALCCTGVALTPWVMRWRKSVELAGNLFMLTLTLGFLGLCFVEGGLEGHAIAWLVSVPLCALLMVDQKSARRWALIDFSAASVVAGLDLAGIKLSPTYAPKWHAIITAGGYLGLILFMFILGLIFENGRARAFARMQAALAELGASNERLVHLNNEKNEFMGIAAHDLKNPLTVILCNAELVTMSQDRAQTEKLCKGIVTVANRMRDLIANLLDANAIEQGNFVSKVVQCDIQALVKQSLEQNLTAATRKQIAFRVGISNGLWAKADRAATLQILDNLISNALKYSPPNTTVHVHALPEAGSVLVKIRDEGPGINAEAQQKLFQRLMIHLKIKRIISPEIILKMILQS